MKIYVKNIRLHAYHGVLAQEMVVGNDYVVNISVDVPDEAACVSDQVQDTINYSEMARLVCDVMSVPCNLLESVAHNIGIKILQQYPKAIAADIDVMKVVPPMSVDCDGAGVSLHVTLS